MKNPCFFDNDDFGCSRFELVILASQRAYDLQSGAQSEIEHPSDDKSPVVALKELQGLKLDHDKLFFSAVKRIIHFSGAAYSGISTGVASGKISSKGLMEPVDKDLIPEKGAEDLAGSDSSFIDDEED